jgi:hypothetical protein
VPKFELDRLRPHYSGVARSFFFYFLYSRVSVHLLRTSGNHEDAPDICALLQKVACSRFARREHVCLKKIRSSFHKYGHSTRMPVHTSHTAGVGQDRHLSWKIFLANRTKFWFPWLSWTLPPIYYLSRAPAHKDVVWSIHVTRTIDRFVKN